MPMFLWSFFKRPSDIFRPFLNQKKQENFSIFQMEYAPQAWEKKNSSNIGSTMHEAIMQEEIRR